MGGRQSNWNSFMRVGRCRNSGLLDALAASLQGFSIAAVVDIRAPHSGSVGY